MPGDVQDAPAHVRDYRDHVIESLADDVARLETDVVAYRMLAQQAIHALHNAVIERERLRDSHCRLLDEYRSLREQTMSASVTA